MQCKEHEDQSLYVTWCTTKKEAKLTPNKRIRVCIECVINTFEVCYEITKEITNM